MWERAVSIWNYPLVTLTSGAVVAVSQIVLVGLLLVIGLIASRWIERIVAGRLAKTHLQADAAHALQRILFYSLVIVIVITALGLLHVPLTAFAFVSGAVAIGVGFGAQNIINNFISGWILMTERPVRIGDFVEIDEAQGMVEIIGNRSTRIRRADGVHLLVPNSLMLERTVVNWTLVDRAIRAIVRVGVAYGSPVREVEKLIHRAVNENSLVKQEPAPRVIFEDFGDNALIFDAYFWCDVSSERELRKIRSDIRFRIADLFSENGIVIAFPQRDVHLDSEMPLRIEVVDAAETRPEGS
ncbi:MAG: mechanosensitive ion channel [Gammaproteobacteria bacterium]|nr:mechanosensitive ion channel [Gammaproteobacteria bacterium]MDH3505901.1 mechanosensitive ion channel [Gammaproteobacteria bacterium]